MISRLMLFCCALLLANLLLVQTVAAQTSAAPEPVQVLVLGTFHFANPGLDVVQTEVADVLSPTKQAEIEEILDAIARFQPTKIAVEVLPASAGRLDSLFSAYLAGRHELSRSETEQLGFRLAARLQHSRVHPIDHTGEFPFGEVMAYAEVHDPKFVGYVQKEIARITEEMNRRQRENTIGEILRKSNDPEQLVEDHGMYLRFARIGAGDSYVGANLLSKWYDRNIRIFANVQQLVEPADRVLIIIGSGHAPILRELIMYDPGMVLIEAVEYLPPPSSR